MSGAGAGAGGHPPVKVDSATVRNALVGKLLDFDVLCPGDTPGLKAIHQAVLKLNRKTLDSLRKKDGFNPVELTSPILWSDDSYLQFSPLYFLLGQKCDGENKKKQIEILKWFLQFKSVLTADLKLPYQLSLLHLVAARFPECFDEVLQAYKKFDVPVPWDALNESGYSPLNAMVVGRQLSSLEKTAEAFPDVLFQVNAKGDYPVDWVMPDGAEMKLFQVPFNEIASKKMEDLKTRLDTAAAKLELTPERLGFYWSIFKDYETFSDAQLAALYRLAASDESVLTELQHNPELHDQLLALPALRQLVEMFLWQFDNGFIDKVFEVFPKWSMLQKPGRNKTPLADLQQANQSLFESVSQKVGIDPTCFLALFEQGLPASSFYSNLSYLLSCHCENTGAVLEHLKGGASAVEASALAAVLDRDLPRLESALSDVNPNTRYLNGLTLLHFAFLNNSLVGIQAIAKKFPAWAVEGDLTREWSPWQMGHSFIDTIMKMNLPESAHQGCRSLLNSLSSLGVPEAHQKLMRNVEVRGGLVKKLQAENKGLVSEVAALKDTLENQSKALADKETVLAEALEKQSTANTGGVSKKAPGGAGAEPADQGKQKRLRAQLKAANMEIKALKSKLFNSEQAAQKARDAQRETERKLEAAGAQIHSKTETNDALVKELDSLKQERLYQETELATVRSDFDELTSRLTVEKEQHQLTKVERDSAREALGDGARAKAEVVRVEASYQAAQKAMEAQRMAYEDELEKMRKQFQSKTVGLTAENGDLKAIIVRLEAQVAALEKEKCTWQASPSIASSASAESEEMKALRKKLTELEAAQAIREPYLRAMEQKAAESSQEMGGLRAYVERLKGQIDELRIQIEAIKEGLARSQAATQASDQNVSWLAQELANVCGRTVTVADVSGQNWYYPPTQPPLPPQPPLPVTPFASSVGTPPGMPQPAASEETGAGSGSGGGGGGSDVSTTRMRSS